MNGRVYDPELGRFLSPDPTVQFLSDLQSYNRYSYTANNPLRYTDPTGYAWYSFMTGSQFWLNLAYGLVGVGMCATGGPAACAMVFYMATVLSTTTMVLEGVMGGNWGQLVTGEAVGLAAGYIGGAVGGEITSALGGSGPWQVVGGAIAGGMGAAITTAATGGNLGQNMLLGAATGALSAAVSWSLQPTNPVSESTAAEQQGGGGQTSGAQKNETVQWGVTVAGYTSGSANGAGGTLVVYGEPPYVFELGANGQPNESGDVVWRLTDDNKDSYEAALKRSVKANLKLTASDVLPVSNLDDIKAALATGNYSKVVYVGHSMNFGDGSGILIPSAQTVSGTELAGVLPASVKDVYFIGCDPSGVAAQAATAAPGVNFHAAGNLLNQNVIFNSSQQVIRITFSPQ
jgi:hypothetical protein